MHLLGQIPKVSKEDVEDGERPSGLIDKPSVEEGEEGGLVVIPGSQLISKRGETLPLRASEELEWRRIGGACSRLSVTVGVKRMHASAMPQRYPVPRLAERIGGILQSPVLNAEHKR